MLSTLGYASVIAGLMGALLAVAAGAHAGLGRSGGETSTALARRAAYFAFFAMSGGMAVMEVALLTHDFSVEYVARVGSLETPTYYTAISLWSSLEGSILFWAWILAGYGALLAFTRRREWEAHRAAGGRVTAIQGGLAPGLRTTPLVIAVIGVVQLFFFGLLATSANPFGLVDPAPANGPGPNPLLQNHPLMGLHPPMLYFGFVGMTVPFAFAIAGLVRGNVEARWLRDSRRWMVAGWAFLTMGIIGGGWWSYEVLGWGGAWAWDPVENASFLPWLTATAFLHSAMVQERRGMLKTWNLSLIDRDLPPHPVRDVPHPLGRHRLGTRLHRGRDRTRVPRVHRVRGPRVARADRVAEQPPARAGTGGERRVAGIGVHPQQPAPRRVHVHGPAGDDVAARRGGHSAGTGSRSDRRTSTASRARSDWRSSSSWGSVPRSRGGARAASKSLGRSRGR